MNEQHISSYRSQNNINASGDATSMSQNYQVSTANDQLQEFANTGKTSKKGFWKNRGKKPNYKGDNPNARNARAPKYPTNIRNVNSFPIRPLYENANPKQGAEYIPDAHGLSVTNDTPFKLLGRFWFSNMGPQHVAKIFQFEFERIKSNDLSLRDSKFQAGLGYSFTYFAIALQLLKTTEITHSCNELNALKKLFRLNIEIPDSMLNLTRQYGNIKVDDGFFKIYGLGGMIIYYLQSCITTFRGFTRGLSLNDKFQQYGVDTENLYLYNSIDLKENIVSTVLLNNPEIRCESIEVSLYDSSKHKVDVNLFKIKGIKLKTYVNVGNFSHDEIKKKLSALADIMDLDYDTIFNGSHSTQLKLLRLTNGEKLFPLARMVSLLSDINSSMQSEFRYLHDKVNFVPIQYDLEGSVCQLSRSDIRGDDIMEVSSFSMFGMTDDDILLGHAMQFDSYVVYKPNLRRTTCMTKHAILTDIFRKLMKRFF